LRCPQFVDELQFGVGKDGLLLRIVVVRDPSGRRRDDCFFSIDLTLIATQVLEIFSRRWPLEVCFRDVKQFLGFEDPQNRVAKATTRTAPLIFFIYDLVLLLRVGPFFFRLRCVVSGIVCLPRFPRNDKTVFAKLVTGTTWIVLRHVNVPQGPTMVPKAGIVAAAHLANWPAVLNNNFQGNAFVRLSTETDGSGILWDRKFIAFNHNALRTGNANGGILSAESYDFIGNGISIKTGSYPTFANQPETNRVFNVGTMSKPQGVVTAGTASTKPVYGRGGIRH
jgi:hypothetical protein